jgi:hypothetical protein
VAIQNTFGTIQDWLPNDMKLKWPGWNNRGALECSQNRELSPDTIHELKKESPTEGKLTLNYKCILSLFPMSLAIYRLKMS